MQASVGASSVSTGSGWGYPNQYFFLAPLFFISGGFGGVFNGGFK